MRRFTFWPAFTAALVSGVAVLLVTARLIGAL